METDSEEASDQDLRKDQSMCVCMYVYKISMYVCIHVQTLDEEMETDSEEASDQDLRKDQSAFSVCVCMHIYVLTDFR